MMKLIVPVVLVVSFIIFKLVTFVLPEGRQAIITEFGKPVGGPITEAGLHLKVPFIQEVRYVDKRILSWDGYPNQIPTKDKKYIMVDTTARWRVVDVLKFIQTVRNEVGAKARLDTIIDSTTRDVISNNNLVEAVRNSNQILEKIQEYEREIEERKQRGEPILEDEVTGEIEEIARGRERLSEMIVELATEELSKLGIGLIDVQLRRISYEESVEQKVYERMISERQRIAQKIRSIGQGEMRIIEGRTTRDLEKIESEAYRKAQEIIGAADARAITIYAASIRRDPRFYDFLRSMEAYERSLKGESRFLLSSDSEFLKYLKAL